MRKALHGAAHTAMALSLAATLGLAACAAQDPKTAPNDGAPQQTVMDDQQGTSAETTDEQGIQSLVDDTETLFADPTQENLERLGLLAGDGTESGYGSYEDQLAYYHNVSLEVTSIDISSDSATVVLGVTNADFAAVNELAQEDSATWQKENGGAAGEQLLEFYNARLLGEDVPTKTVTCSLACSRQADGSWAWDELPGANQAFVAALSGVTLPD